MTQLIPCEETGIVLKSTDAFTVVHALIIAGVVLLVIGFTAITLHAYHRIKEELSDGLSTHEESSTGSVQINADDE
jgi:heme/copper-type cytochrome/quinol oxidase subunit 2